MSVVDERGFYSTVQYNTAMHTLVFFWDNVELELDLAARLLKRFTVNSCLI